MLTTLSHYFCRKALPQISNWVLNVALNCVCSNKVMYLILCKLSFSFSKFSWLQNNWLLHKLEWSWSNTFIAICICKELSSILENVITQPIKWNRLRILWLVKSFKGCVHYICAVCFLSLNESTCQTRKNVFYFTSKALFVLKKIKF